MLVVALSASATLLALAYAFFAFRFYLNLKRDLNYSLAKLFLKGSSIHAFTLFLTSLLLFTIARAISFAILLGAFGEEVIVYVRSPIELAATLALTVSLATLYWVTRRSKASEPSSPL